VSVLEGADAVKVADEMDGQPSVEGGVDDEGVEGGGEEGDVGFDGDVDGEQGVGGDGGAQG